MALPQTPPWFNHDIIVTRSEGFTPIYWDDRLASYAGIERLGLKHEGPEPNCFVQGSRHDRRHHACPRNGSDRGRLRLDWQHLGVSRVYAAAARMSALVLIPEGKIAGGKLAQTIAHGARIVQIEGDFDIALSLLRE